MADAFIGELRIFPYIFNPAGWFPCDGRQMSIASYSALYSLLGIRYGGDGRTTFNLPNLAGYIPVSLGTAQTGTTYTIAQKIGAATVTLVSATQLGTHNHNMSGRVSTGNPSSTGMTAKPNTTAPLSMLSRALTSSSPPRITGAYSTPGPTAPTTNVGAQVSAFGTGGPHSNMMPYLEMGYFICWDGVYPVNPN